MERPVCIESLGQGVKELGSGCCHRRQNHRKKDFKRSHHTRWDNGNYMLHYRLIEDPCSLSGPGERVCCSECCVSCTAICGGWSLHCHSLVGGASIHQPILVGGAWGLTCQGTVGWTMGDELARLCPRSAGYAALHVSTHVCHSHYMPSDFPSLSMALILKEQLK